MDRAQAKKIYYSGKEAVIAKLVEFSLEIEALEQIIIALEGRIEQLENKQAKDGHYSSKPPSSDGFK